jgi:hypothetical protein
MPLHMLCVFNYVMHVICSFDSIMLLIEVMEDAINDNIKINQVNENIMTRLLLE